MGRPAGGYYLADGTRVPSVTTLLGHRKSAEGLIHWAWNEGREGRDYRETRESAANKGRLVHRMIEQHYAGDDPFTVDGVAVADPEVLRAFSAFAAWFDSAGAKIVSSEVSLVSEKHRYGGTPDAMLLFYIDGLLEIGDWKTSKALYGDFIIQIAAYAALWDENHPDRPITGGGHLLRFDKETGAHEHVRISREMLNLGFEAFQALQEVYQADRVLDKAIKKGRAA